MVSDKAQLLLDAGAAIWLVNAAVEAGREDIVGALVAEVEDADNRRHMRGAADQDG